MKNRTFWVYALGMALAFGALILMPEFTSAAVTDGLRLCAGVIVPSLFPFFVCTNLMTRLGLTDRLTRLLRPLGRRLFGSAALTAPFVLGLLGGYPAGAKVTANLYRDGRLTKEQAETALRFCNNSGPAFVFGVMGSRVFGSVRAGAALYLIHAASALLCGVLHKQCGAEKAALPEGNAERFSAAFTLSVRDAGETALQVGMFVTVFSVLSAFGRRLFCAVLPEALLPFFAGMLELSGGAQVLSEAVLPLPFRFITASFLLGFGGLSVLAQSRALLEQAGLGDSKLFPAKLRHGLFSALLAASLFYPLLLLPIGTFCLLFLKLRGRNLRPARV